MCARFLFCLVIAIVFVNIETRPTKRDVTNNSLDNSGLDEHTFKVPMMIREGLVITVKGILNPNDATFNAYLSSATDGDNCQIVYNFEKQTLVVMPGTSSDNEPSLYRLEMDSTGMNTFILKFKARIANGGPIFDLTFEGNDHLKTGPSDILPCKIKSFEDISYIVIKEGVQSVTSLLFEFPK